MPKPTTGSRVFGLLREHKPGRKRLIDTYLAATLLDHGITALITCDTSDFQIFPQFEIINPLIHR